MPSLTGGSATSLRVERRSVAFLTNGSVPTTNWGTREGMASSAAWLCSRCHRTRASLHDGHLTTRAIAAGFVWRPSLSLPSPRSTRPVLPPNASPRNGGRRCRRTWTSCARSTRPGNAATSPRRLGGPRDRVRARRRTDADQRQRASLDGRDAGAMAERLGGLRAEAEEYRELDDERVLVLCIAAAAARPAASRSSHDDGKARTCSISTTAR